MPPAFDCGRTLLGDITLRPCTHTHTHKHMKGIEHGCMVCVYVCVRVVCVCVCVCAECVFVFVCVRARVPHADWDRKRD